MFPLLFRNHFDRLEKRDLKENESWNGVAIRTVEIIEHKILFVFAQIFTRTSFVEEDFVYTLDIVDSYFTSLDILREIQWAIHMNFFFLPFEHD